MQHVMRTAAAIALGSSWASTLALVSASERAWTDSRTSAAIAALSSPLATASRV